MLRFLVLLLTLYLPTTTIFIPVVHSPGVNLTIPIIDTPEQPVPVLSESTSIFDGPSPFSEAAYALNIPYGLNVGIPLQPGPSAVWYAKYHFVRDGFTYYDWSANGAVPMVWTVKNQAYMNSIRTAIANGDTRLWLIENEPGQGGQSSSTIADIQNALVEIDGTSVQWACCGLNIHDYSGWQAFMQQYKAQGLPLPDAWHIHLYPWYDWHMYEMFGDFYWWTVANGMYRPIIVSEISGVAGIGYEWQKPIMDAAILMAQYGWFRSAFWFSSYYFSNGNEPDRNLLWDTGYSYSPTNLGYYLRANR